MRIFDFFRKKETEQNNIQFEVAKTQRGDYEDLYKNLLRSSLIILINGKRGSGKTALGMKFLEIFRKHSKRKLYALGFESVSLPFWIKKSENIDDIKNDSVALIDEGGLKFSSRESMKKENKELGKIMSIARHKNLTLILIAQNSAMIDLNVLRLTDIIALKEPSLLQSQFERKPIKEMYEKAMGTFKTLDDKKSHFFVISDDFEGLLKYSLPNFWNEDISKSFKGFK